MRLNNFSRIMLVISIFVSLFLVSCSHGSKDVNHVSTQWPKVESQTKPWTRWWWLGNAVDSANLRYNLEAMAEAGIGGVEITPLYGVKGYEDQFIDHLSPKWMEMLDYTISTAHELGMQVDMVQGTGWPFGGPHVEPEYAASKLIVQDYSLNAGETLTSISVNDKKQVGKAVLESVLLFQNGEYVKDIIETVDSLGMLNYKADSKVEVYAVFCGKTRQQVKRSAPGGEGYTLDHYSKEALMDYVKPYEATICKNKSKLRALFNDSYEVYGTTWTPDFLTKFEELRGYDLRPYIPLMESGEESETLARVLCDYRETISDLLLNNFMNPWREWANENGYVTKNQSHGSPGNLLDLYGAADIPECETFGSTPFDVKGLRRDSLDIRSADPDPVMLKFSSSAANVYGKQLVSSESFTWLREHFRGALSHCKPELEQLFLSGVNHVFFHGATYSPKEDAWPGWKFYASMNFHPNNPIWKESPGFFEYIARCQSVLQTTASDNDLLVYWPAYDVFDDTENAKGYFMQLNIHEIAHWLYPTEFYKVSNHLMDNGYAYDFVSERGIEALGNNGEVITTKGASEYKAIVLPKCEHIPAATFQNLLNLATNGATVVIQGLPKDVPGLNKLEERRAQLNALVKSIEEKLGGKASGSIAWGKGKIVVEDDVVVALSEKDIYGETIAKSGLDYIRKRFEGGWYYYVVNHTAETIKGAIPFSNVGEAVVLMDPQSGKTGLASFKNDGDKLFVNIEIESGRSMFVKVLEQPFMGEAWEYYSASETQMPITSGWNLEFVSGGPDLPKAIAIDTLGSWASFGGAYEIFAGTGKYSTSFKFVGEIADNYILDLGDVRETAHVYINGKDVGSVWANPYRIEVGKYIQSGENTLEIEVTNLGANRIRHLDAEGVNWKKFYNTNIVTVAYKPFDASVWDVVPSGLLGPVNLIPLSIQK